MSGRKSARINHASDSGSGSEVRLINRDSDEESDVEQGTGNEPQQEQQETWWHSYPRSAFLNILSSSLFGVLLISNANCKTRTGPVFLIAGGLSIGTSLYNVRQSKHSLLSKHNLLREKKSIDKLGVWLNGLSAASYLATVILNISKDYNENPTQNTKFWIDMATNIIFAACLTANTITLTTTYLRWGATQDTAPKKEWKIRDQIITAKSYCPKRDIFGVAIGETVVLFVTANVFKSLLSHSYQPLYYLLNLATGISQLSNFAFVPNLFVTISTDANYSARPSKISKILGRLSGLIPAVWTAVSWIRTSLMAPRLPEIACILCENCALPLTIWPQNDSSGLNAINSSCIPAFGNITSSAFNELENYRVTINKHNWLQTFVFSVMGRFIGNAAPISISLLLAILKVGEIFFEWHGNPYLNCGDSFWEKYVKRPMKIFCYDPYTGEFSLKKTLINAAYLAYSGQVFIYSCRLWNYTLVPSDISYADNNLITCPSKQPSEYIASGGCARGMLKDSVLAIPAEAIFNTTIELVVMNASALVLLVPTVVDWIKSWFCPNASSAESANQNRAIMADAANSQNYGTTAAIPRPASLVVPNGDATLALSPSPWEGASSSLFSRKPIIRSEAELDDAGPSSAP